MRFWYLLHRRAVRAQTSLCIYAVTLGLSSRLSYSSDTSGKYSMLKTGVFSDCGSFITTCVESFYSNIC